MLKCLTATATAVIQTLVLGNVAVKTYDFCTSVSFIAFLLIKQVSLTTVFCPN